MFGMFVKKNKLWIKQIIGTFFQNTAWNVVRVRAKREF